MPNTSNDHTQRIAKWIAHSGLCSRRDAEKLIEAKRVTVAGELVETPAFKLSDPSTIQVDGEALPALDKPRMWLLHKPKGVITTHKDPQNRPTVFDLLPDTLPRVISIGRLDFNTEGLLLLTNNGELARHLELPSTGWIRKYRVRGFGRLNQKHLAEIEKGATVEGICYAPATIEMSKQQKDKGQNLWLNVSITEGKNREVRKLLEYAGLKVNRLIRTAFGPFNLADLEPGEFQEVPKKHLDNFLGNWQKK